MRILGLLVFPVAGLCAPAFAADTLPESGSAKLAAYQVCRPLAVIDLGTAGSQSATECNGILKSLDGKGPDNLAIHCLEDTSARTEGYKYSGACTQTDSDGDKLYMSYEGAKSGQAKWIGGTGKYKDVSGSGGLSVIVAPAGTSSLFAYTLNFDVTWTNKAK